MKPDPSRLDAAIYPFALEITTRFADMDYNGHLNNVAYAQYFEHGRIAFNKATIFDDGVLPHPEARAWRILVAAISIAYLREGAYGPPVTIAIGVGKLGTSSFTLAAACFQDGACLATHECVVAFKGPEGRLPDAMRAKLEAQLLKGPMSAG
jgi:acyl-CoA thioester hydrolase